MAARGKKEEIKMRTHLKLMNKFQDNFTKMFFQDPLQKLLRRFHSTEYDKCSFQSEKWINKTQNTFKIATSLKLMDGYQKNCRNASLMAMHKKLLK